MPFIFTIGVNMLGRFLPLLLFTTFASICRVSYPNKLGTTIEADSLQKLIMKFSLKDKSTNKPMIVHQAFVRLYKEEKKQEIIFVAEPDSSKTYKFDIVRSISDVLFSNPVRYLLSCSSYYINEIVLYFRMLETKLQNSATLLVSTPLN